MAKTEEKEKDSPKELEIPKEASIDKEVQVESLEGDPYHKNGTKFGMGEKRAKELAEKGWVKILK